MVRHASTWLIALGVLFFGSGQAPIGQPSGFIITPNQQQNVTSVTGIPPTIPPGNPISFTYWVGNVMPGVQEQALINLINSHRAGIGLKAVKWHSGLGRGARDHNIAMNGTLSFVAAYPASVGTPGTWDIVGRFQRAQPRIRFKDLAIILGAQQLPGVTSNASVFFTGGILPSQSARLIIERKRYTTIGCNLSTANNTWVIIFGDDVTPNVP